MTPSPHPSPEHTTPARASAHSLRRRVFAPIALLVALTATLALTQQQPQSPRNSPANVQPPPSVANLPPASALPTVNDPMQFDRLQNQTKAARLEAANAERKRQIADDAARLLELATELKAAVDKTDKDTLSIQVIRKAESIEKLAKGVKEKMKMTAGAS